MAIPWTAHIPQALQQHGAGRRWQEKPESDRLADLKAHAAQRDQAEDAASRIAPETRREG